MRKLDHIGIYVRSIDDASKIYERLGFPIDRTVNHPRADGSTIRIAFIPVADGVDIELLENPEALERGLEALHHICFEVPDIHAELSCLAEEGVPIATPQPVRGAAARLISFLQPAAADGVRIELAEK